MKVYMLIFLMLIFGFTGSLFGEDLNASFVEISGELPGKLTSEKPYLVVGDIYVSPGSTVIIDAGTILLFDGFTGLHVQGPLYVKGTKEHPVVFTSKFDSLVNVKAEAAPAPFDWNGIDVYENAIGTDFTFCEIKYSVYGIRSQTEYLKIYRTLFSDNGKSDFTLKDVRMEVISKEPFSYTDALKSKPESGVATTLNAAQSNSPADPAISSVAKKGIRAGGPKLLRYAGLLVGAGCSVYSGVTYTTKFKPAQAKLEELSELDEYEMHTATSKDWDAAKEERDSSLSHSIIGAVGALLGLLTFSISFTI